MIAYPSTIFDIRANLLIIQKLNYMENELSSEVNNRELEMLTHIEANPDINQVTLADELGVAVGTINWHLKRMIAKGYVKVNGRSARNCAISSRRKGSLSGRL